MPIMFSIVRASKVIMEFFDQKNIYVVTFAVFLCKIIEK